MILYTSEFCPFCHSCRLVLAAKGLEFKECPLDLENKGDFPEKTSPYRRVPVLVHRGRKIFESAIINEYLDEVFPTVAMMPDDPAQRAQVRFWVDFVHDRLVPAYFQVMNSDEPADWPDLNARLAGWFRFAEARAFEAGWVCGPDLSLADFCLYPWIERFVSVERYRGGAIPEDCVKLSAWIDAMQGTAVVQDCAKTREQYVTFFDHFWRPLA